MNNAEHIILCVKLAVERDTITRKDAVRILSSVASMLNGNGNETKVDMSEAMRQLNDEVHQKWSVHDKPSP